MAKDSAESKGKAKPKTPENDKQLSAKGEDGKSKIWEDPRFQHLVTDPRFKNLPKVHRKVKIDKRFQGMFTDDKFKVKYEVDKYGRRVGKSNAEDLKKYYELEGSSDEEDEEALLEEQRKEEKALAELDKSEDEQSDDMEKLDDEDLTDDEVPKSLRERLVDPTVDYARGEGRLLTDSSSDEESSDEDDDPELQIDHVWGELDNDAETINEATKRLAVCNMDWDRIRAEDLMVLFHSFLPVGGCIVSIKIYPSEFGKERMAEEEKNGPIELKGLGKKSNKTKEGSDDEELVQEQDSDAEEGDEYHMEKLRQYQLNRLRYYYAVVECDSAITADKLYKECDGIEYESSASKVDLRFIPDDTSFDEDVPTDVCSKVPDPNLYKPRQFTTTALQQAKVDLTWDETAVERRELNDKLASGKLDDIDDKELRKIVAYSSEEEEESTDDNDDKENDKEEEENKKEETTDDFFLESTAQSKPDKGSKKKQKKEDMISKYKALLAEINEKEQNEKKNKYEMEYSWNIEGAAEETSNNDDKDKDGEKAKKNSNLTPIEKILQKRAEKNKKRKEERKLKKKQANGGDVQDSDSDSIPDGLDMNDPYFAEEFANGDFEDPNKKKSKASKNKKKNNSNEEEDEEEKRREQELALLLEDDEEVGKQHFSLEKILKAEQDTKTNKRKRKKQLKKSKAAIAETRKELDDNFEINLNDDRFKAIYSSPNFNIDPTDSHFKKTKAMEKLIHEKLKRRHGDSAPDSEPSATATNGADSPAADKRPRKDLDNRLLIKSLKRKLQQH